VPFVFSLSYFSFVLFVLSLRVHVLGFGALSSGQDLASPIWIFPSALVFPGSNFRFAAGRQFILARSSAARQDFLDVFSARSRSGFGAATIPPSVFCFQLVISLLPAVCQGTPA
jgi:hypothetical protein